MTNNSTDAWWQDEKYWIIQDEASDDYDPEVMPYPNLPAIIQEAQRMERERIIKELNREFAGGQENTIYTKSYLIRVIDKILLT